MAEPLPLRLSVCYKCAHKQSNDKNDEVSYRSRHICCLSHCICHRCCRVAQCQRHHAARCSRARGAGLRAGGAIPCRSLAARAACHLQRRRDARRNPSDAASTSSCFTFAPGPPGPRDGIRRLERLREPRACAGDSGHAARGNPISCRRDQRRHVLDAESAGSSDDRLLARWACGASRRWRRRRIQS